MQYLSQQTVADRSLFKTGRSLSWFWLYQLYRSAQCKQCKQCKQTVFCLSHLVVAVMTSAAIWTVLILTALRFVPLLFCVRGFPLSEVAHSGTSMILCAWLPPVWSGAQWHFYDFVCVASPCVKWRTVALLWLCNAFCCGLHHLW